MRLPSAARGLTSDARSSLAVLVLALLTIALGFYMAVIRPPLLPEDVRFLGVDPSSLPPSLLRWLSVVFETWGAFVTVFGVVLFGVANALRTARTNVLRWATALALMIAFGRSAPLGVEPFLKRLELLPQLAGAFGGFFFTLVVAGVPRIIIVEIHRWSGLTRWCFILSPTR